MATPQPNPPRFSRILLITALLLSAGRLLQLLLGIFGASSAVSFSQNALAFEQTLVLFFLLLLAGAAARSTESFETNKSPLLVLLSTGGLLLGIVLLTILLVNPRGLYPANLIPQLSYDTRAEKTSFYQALPASPDVAFLGSSRAFTLAPNTLQEATGLSGFNFTVDAARLDDYLIETRFMIANGGLPPVLFIEVLPSLQTDSARTAERSPIILIPYMNRDTAELARQLRLTELFNLNQFNEAAYVLRAVTSAGAPLPDVIFNPDGFGAYNDDVPLETALQEDIETRVPANCQKPDSAGRRFLREIIGLAADQHSIVILYTSPMHPDYYEQVALASEHYLTCQAAFEEFLTGLAADYSNFRYLDYSQLASIGGTADETGFRDAVHLRPPNSDLLLQAASSTIQDAYTEALNWRNEP